MRTIKYIVIHCTAGPRTQKTSAILDFWKRVKGWKQVGYHKLISEDGTVEELAKPEVVVNGVRGQNSHSYHICYKGGQGGKDNRTDAQKASLLSEIKKARVLFPDAQILGHRDLSPDLNDDGIISPNEWTKECPSFDAKKEYENI